MSSDSHVIRKAINLELAAAISAILSGASGCEQRNSAIIEVFVTGLSTEGALRIYPRQSGTNFDPNVEVINNNISHFRKEIVGLSYENPQVLNLEVDGLADAHGDGCAQTVGHGSAFIGREGSYQLQVALARPAPQPKIAGVSLTDILDKNLLENGSADGYTTSGRYRLLSGWATTGSTSVEQYGIWPTNSTPRPSVNDDPYFISGGDITGISTAGQLIDVSAEHAAIDAQQVEYSLGGYLGGFFEQDDNAVVTATFRGSSDATGPIGMVSIGPVTVADRAGGTLSELRWRAASGVLPTGTRSIEIDVTMTRCGGIDNDGYADNLSLVLTRRQ